MHKGEAEKLEPTKITMKKWSVKTESILSDVIKSNRRKSF